ncbi:MAG: 4-hydroxybenzoate octaprenyltransferase [Candidatus Xenolissoclinum pacificiensis L6]|uniref:4-hydroxybenzoate octaprenyltransferase n=1 Tax=Candidatus Xenolissoclinum pacificiensis L6 TaxID=1401685 RepID=W2UZ67_9RICK|nr:MAG: 4-hydroxybenzoate octaprenyltransferase [Candidatus Xenolissoclinum pacificiensis L6]
MYQKIYDGYLQLIRAQKPVGFFLLLFPCLFSLACETQSLFAFFLWMIFFSIGAFVMRSAGCIINDIIDSKFDNHVNRTKDRPIASDRVSIHEALYMLIPNLIIGMLLLLVIGLKSFMLALVSLVFMIIYPYCKRFIDYAQICLAFVFNTGVLFVSIAVHNHITFNSVVLYLACVFWTVLYDTIYAHQDKEDDLRIGLKSMALTEHGNRKWLLRYLYAVFILIFANVLLLRFSIITVIGIFLIFAFMYYDIEVVDLDNPKHCGFLFKKQGFLYQPLVLIVLLLGKRFF